MSQLHSQDVASTSNLSIIIVNWNTRDLLAQCLHSVLTDIRALPSLRVETLVVDNASTDGSVQLVWKQFPWVQLIVNKKNVGFATANNQAIRASLGRYVLLLNSDTKIKLGALKTLVDFLDSHVQAGAVGAYLLNSDETTLQTSCYPFPTLWRELWRLFHLDVLYPVGIYQMANWDLNTAREVDVIQGAALMLRREALNQVGLLDERYFMYTEEVDLCYRLQKGGWLLFWVPQSKVVHYGGQSAKQVAADMFLCLYQSKLIFIKKHYGSLATKIYKFILFAATITRLLLTPLAYLEQHPRRQQHLNLAKHYHRLLTELPRF